MPQIQGRAVLDALIARGVHRTVPSMRRRDRRLIEQAVAAALPLFDAASREYAYHRNQEMLREYGRDLADLDASHRSRPKPRLVPPWRRHVAQLDDELLARAAPIFTRLVLDQLLDRATIIDPAVAAYHRGVCGQVRAAGVAAATRPHQPTAGRRPSPSRTAAEPASSPLLEPQPILDAIQDELSRRFSRRLLLWKVERDELAAFGGELDTAVQMPGWTNVWTMPIQNRVDMLATGVNTPIGIRVLGPQPRRRRPGLGRGRPGRQAVPGAVDVVADPIRGKPYIEIRLDRDRAARLGVSAGEVNELIETALAGKVVTHDGRGPRAAPGRRPLRPGLARGRRIGPQPAGDGPRRQRAGARHSPAKPEPRQVPLSEVAEVQVVEGPATIKSENGLLRNYVRLNVRGRDAADLVAEAKLAVASEARLPGRRLRRVDRPVRARAPRAADADRWSCRSWSP